ncbi:MAG: enoyl-CoA hydratase/isomerase family protein [Actinomycetia bacterium]|nr:enoyl-CoA hydratase/isomerase family protein [Actinomycetes bacterium]
MDEEGGIVSVVSDGVSRITFNRPERRNAFTAAGYRRFAALLRAAAADPGVAVVVVNGAGAAFCSGVDRAALADLQAGGSSEELGGTFVELLEALATFPKPLIGAVHGYAIGFGMTMLLHFDLVLVESGTRMRLPFVELGVAPEAGSSYLLPARVGAQTAAWLLMSGDWVDAPTAVELGLAWREYPAPVLEQGLAVARQLASGSPAALEAAKRLLVAGRLEPVLAAFDRERRTAV